MYKNFFDCQDFYIAYIFHSYILQNQELNFRERDSKEVSYMPHTVYDSRSNIVDLFKICLELSLIIFVITLSVIGALVDMETAYIRKLRIHSRNYKL